MLCGGNPRPGHRQNPYRCTAWAYVRLPPEANTATICCGQGIEFYPGTPESSTLWWITVVVPAGQPTTTTGAYLLMMTGWLDCVPVCWNWVFNNFKWCRIYAKSFRLRFPPTRNNPNLHDPTILQECKPHCTELHHSEFYWNPNSLE